MKRLIYILVFSACITQTESIAQIYGEPIVGWDFEDGIPSDWLNETEDGVSFWEYRGPGTEPDNSICSRGSCGAESVPPASESLSNGFVIFDSNYWDEPEGACGNNPGSGLAPGPHSAFLTSPSIDLSNEENVVLTFQQQYRHWFNVSSRVQISIDQSNWQDLIVNSGFSSPNVEWKTINITEIVAGSSDVRIRFVFIGRLFHWCLDDIYLYTPNDNDLLLTDPYYTDYLTNNGPSDLENMEYHVYPLPFSRDLIFSAQCTNVGGVAQGGVKLNIDILDNDENTVLSQPGPILGLMPGITTTLNGGPDFDISQLSTGKYRIDFEVDQNQEDENPANNFASKDFEISEYSYGRDEGASEGDYNPVAQFSEETFELGNIFQATENGFEMHSLAVCVSDSTLAGSIIYGKVYDLTLDTLLAESDSFEVNSAFLNGLGESKWIVVPLTNPLPLDSGVFYNVQLGATSSPENKVRICLSGEGPIQSSFLVYPDVNQFFYITRTPMVRMQVFPDGSISGCLDETADNYNPEAELNDGSCLYFGCTDPLADNYDPDANFEDGSCANFGCTDEFAENYNPGANTDDGSCVYDEAEIIVNPVSACSPVDISIQNLTNVVPGAQCSFTLNGNVLTNSCAESLEFNLSTSGLVSIIYTYTVNEYTSSAEVQIELFPDPDSPNLEFNSEDNTILCDGCESIFTYWYLNDNLIDSGDNISSITAPSDGTYSVIVETENGCQSTSGNLEVVVTSIDKLSVKNLKIYPNPSKGIFNVESYLEESLDLTVSDLTGRLVIKDQLLAHQKIKQINLLNESPGIYLLKLSNDETVITEKLILE